MAPFVQDCVLLMIKFLHDLLDTILPCPMGPCSYMVYTWALKYFLCPSFLGHVYTRYLDPLGKIWGLVSQVMQDFYHQQHP